VRAVYFEWNTLLGGTGQSHWVASGATDIVGTDGDNFTDDDTYTWDLLIAGTGQTVYFEG
jgi:hypothetical protein